MHPTPTAHTSVFRFSFAPAVDLVEAEATLTLAILAAEGLFGESRVRTEVTYYADAPRSSIAVDGSTESGAAVVRIYISLLTREFGADAFTVRRMASPRPPQGHGPAVIETASAFAAA